MSEHDANIDTFPRRWDLVMQLRGILRTQLGLTDEFEEAVIEVKQQDNEELFRRCMEADKIQAEGTNYAIAIIGRERMTDEMLDALSLSGDASPSRNNIEKLSDGKLTRLHADLMEASRRSDALIRGVEEGAGYESAPLNEDQHLVMT